MPDWRRNLYIIWVAELLAIAGFSVVLPFMPFYVQELGVTDPAQVKLWSGLLISVQAVTMAVVAPVWGALADRYGRKMMAERPPAIGAAGASRLYHRNGVRSDDTGSQQCAARTGWLGDGFAANGDLDRGISRTTDRRAGRRYVWLPGSLLGDSRLAAGRRGGGTFLRARKFRGDGTQARRADWIAGWADDSAPLALLDDRLRSAIVGAFGLSCYRTNSAPFHSSAGPRPNQGRVGDWPGFRDWRSLRSSGGGDVGSNLRPDRPAASPVGVRAGLGCTLSALRPGGVDVPGNVIPVFDRRSHRGYDRRPECNTGYFLSRGPPGGCIRCRHQCHLSRQRGRAYARRRVGGGGRIACNFYLNGGCVPGCFVVYRPAGPQAGASSMIALS